VLVFPHAKINLGLFITSKRSDGFHNLETCFLPVPWTDALEILPSEMVQFTTTGLPVTGEPENNLCQKAYRLLAKDFSLPPVQMHLHKVIPMGAGLGGGSSDGAFTLRCLNALFALQLSTEQLLPYATQLGSDCAFFLQDKPMLATGRGELLEPAPLDLKGWHIVLIYPGVHSDTAAAYRAIKPKPAPYSLREVLQLPVSDWRGKLTNDFETPLFLQHKKLRLIKDLLYEAGANYAAMSGSGSTLFGLFQEAPPTLPPAPAGTLVWQGIL